MFYTIHFKNNNNPYILHLKNQQDQYKSTLVSMLNKKDSYTIARILEHHKETKNTYPDNSFEYKNLFNTKIKVNIPINYQTRLNDFIIRSWRQDELIHFCVDYWLDLLLIEDLEKTGAIQIVEFELNKEYLIEKLNSNLK